ncbi:DNA repair nuclease, XPF-type/Helicase, partial [Cynara cardunculus var. scolymus]
MEDTPKGISESNAMTLLKASKNVCSSKTPIKTLKDFSKVKNKGNTQYVPQKNSVAYALLITLYRGIANGNDFMRKQELIDAAEASGLSRSPIMPTAGKGKPGQFGVSSDRDWYSGWSCMKKLIDKGLAVKSSCPAKYMLTEQGKEAARDCLLRSGLVDPVEDLTTGDKTLDLNLHNMKDPVCTHARSVEDVTSQHTSSSCQKKSVEIPPDTLNKLVCMGYSKEQVIRAFSEVAEKSPYEDTSSLWLSVLCRLREVEVYSSPLDSENILEESSSVANLASAWRSEIPKPSLKACSSTDQDVHKRGRDNLEAKLNVLSMPPLMFGERFVDIYEVVLILDDREKFTKESRSRNLLENLRKHLKIPIEVRRLPVGDGIWIARHKHLGSEYVLDFIVERKNVNDLRSSIRDNRYKEQKVRILRSGLKRLIYLVEGNPNTCEGAESIKTACMTTEILEGFDVQRTNDLVDTLHKYGHLTRSIIEYYKSLGNEAQNQDFPVCPPFDQFIKRCQELDQMTVSDVFAIQLMQVPQVTEDVAIAVLDLYPTVLSLSRAYSNL